jgi:hypothetical protein
MPVSVHIDQNSFEIVCDYTKMGLAKYSSVLGEKPTLKEKNTTQSPPN